MELKDLGWNDFFTAQLAQFENKNLIPGRISLQQKKSFQIISEKGLFSAHVSGKFLHHAATIADFPVVGDWVLFSKNEHSDKAVIHHVLLRHTKISRDTNSRKGKHRTIEEQVIVANVDTIFLITSLDEDLNINRIERYLAMIWEGGASPVLLLNKADVCHDVDERVDEIRQVLPTVELYVLSALNGEGLDAFVTHLTPGKTIALLGSSGVGKSTLVNKLVGREYFKVGDIGNYKDKGRHTTTHREMIILDNGAILIDNPGMRAIQLMDAQEGLERSFESIEAFSKYCRFSDCKHEQEPDCAVKKAVQDGEISQERYESYLKLVKETAFQQRRQDKEQQANTKKRWKSVSKTMRNMQKKR